jgi:gluconate 2-dehydrogenase gamma chain
MNSAGVNRRNLLTAGVAVGSAAVSAAVLGGPAESRSITGGMPWDTSLTAAPSPAVPGALAPSAFFTSEERTFIDAAVARFIPADELGPGAKEAGVTTFIDRQLAGAFGQAQTWYMQGPWGEGTASQGFQSRLTPAQMYRAAIKAIDAHCRQAFGNKAFAALSADDQDKVLAGLEKGETDLQGVNGKSFFEAFLQNTVEGFFSDPIYGGNREMVGWKLIGFPGARYDYRDYVGKHGEKFPLPPVGLKGRPDWNPRT